MIVYLHGSPGKPPVASHTLILCPAGHRPHDCPEDHWWFDNGKERKARQYEVEFKHGEAEVEDHLGRYMLSSGLAKEERFQYSGFWTPG